MTIRIVVTIIIVVIITAIVIVLQPPTARIGVLNIRVSKMLKASALVLEVKALQDFLVKELSK